MTGRWRGSWLPAAVVLVVALAVVAADVVLWLDRREAQAADHARAAALAAARSAATDLLSYDYRRMTADISRAEADTTGPFATDYRRTAHQLAAQARQNRAIVQATASRPGIVSADAHRVVVLVFVDQASVKQLTGQRTPTTRIDQSRVRLTMTDVHGRWLVSQLDAL